MTVSNFFRQSLSTSMLNSRLTLLFEIKNFNEKLILRQASKMLKMLPIAMLHTLHFISTIYDLMSQIYVFSCSNRGKGGETCFFQFVPIPPPFFSFLEVLKS